MTEPSIEKLTQIRDELQEEIREARGMLKDLRRETKEARELVPLLVDELFQAEVKKQVDQLGTATKEAMDAAVKRVFAKFDELGQYVMGEDRASRRKGKVPLPDLFKARAVLDAAQREREGGR
ncbi:hypothetical protein [Streptomyces fuscichromogenes]|uniref:Uncharacterized protein n=1 Tax=Streptomyces fuscichromogenes TaxID=1324013 RepID=A0A917XR86_9ACTN|nr:hypothetical protein [Streptomyces fuscichromogenes]GGN47523.1 hypothetical protein GCM10011578_101120 [Streptomyces fuscichromogenes]